MFFKSKSKLKTKNQKLREFYEEEDRQFQINRVEAIKKIANRNMDRVDPLKGRRHDQLWVQVPYDDLLRMWNISCRIKEHL